MYFKIFHFYNMYFFLCLNQGHPVSGAVPLHLLLASSHWFWVRVNNIICNYLCDRIIMIRIYKENFLIAFFFYFWLDCHCYNIHNCFLYCMGGVKHFKFLIFIVCWCFAQSSSKTIFNRVMSDGQLFSFFLKFIYVYMN